MREQTETRTPRVSIFLCHASEDKPAVRDLYQRLQDDGFAPWLDEVQLLPGQHWRQEIASAIRATDVFLVCLSSKSVSKAGYLNKEIVTALDVADEQPEGVIYIIPVKLEECHVPERLRTWQWVNLFDEQGYERLVQALLKRAESLSASDNAPAQPAPLPQRPAAGAVTINNQAPNQGVQGTIIGNITINKPTNQQ